MSAAGYLLPYDFSPLTVFSFAAVLGLYGIALLQMPAADRPGPIRIVTFVLGVMLCYTVMQTRFDYYSQYMFFVHRGQHLILHHLGPILIALSNPLPLRATGMALPAPAAAVCSPHWAGCTGCCNNRPLLRCCLSA